MKLEINEKEVTLKYGFKALMIYEKLAGESFQAEGLTEILTLMYACVLATGEFQDLTFDNFIEWMDEHPMKLTEFSQWLTNIFKVDEKLNGTTEESPKEKGKGKAKKK